MSVLLVAVFVVVAVLMVLAVLVVSAVLVASLVLDSDVEFELELVLLVWVVPFDVAAVEVPELSRVVFVACDSPFVGEPLVVPVGRDVASSFVVSMPASVRGSNVERPVKLVLRPPVVGRVAAASRSSKVNEPSAISSEASSAASRDSLGVVSTQ